MDLLYFNNIGNSHSHKAQVKSILPFGYSKQGSHTHSFELEPIDGHLAA